MSYSLAVADGDLVQKGSQLGIVFGKDKLTQDIYLLIMERYGGDRFHVNMGSTLQDYVGSIASESTRAEVHAEIFRVLQNYQAVQLRRFRENPELLSASELLVSVDAIQTAMNYDTINAAIKLRNGSDQATTINVVQST